MTISKEYSIEVSEIKAVRLICHKCQASLSLPPSDIKQDPPEHCPNCGTDWFLFRSIELQQLKSFLLSIKAFSERTGKPECQVRLEISQPC
jgi:DNA-directed RNA polymerase subunit RPC12/RpoP